MACVVVARVANHRAMDPANVRSLAARAARLHARGFVTMVKAVRKLMMAVHV